MPRIGRLWDRTRLEEAGREMRQSKAKKAGRRDGAATFQRRNPYR